MVNLLQPLLSLPSAPPDACDQIRCLLLKHAQEGLELLIQYREAYSAFYQSPLQLFSLVHICDALVSHGINESESASVIRFCINYLEDAKSHFPLADSLQRMFATSMNELKIDIPQDVEHLVSPSHMYPLDVLLDACTRLSYKAPIAQILPNLSPNLAQDFVYEWQAIGGLPLYDQDHSPTSSVSDAKSMSGATRSMNIQDILNE